MDDETPAAAGHNRLKGIDPERLLVLDVEEISPLLDVQYPDLAKRGAELLEQAVAWATTHKRDGVLAILNDAEMNHASDLFSQLRTFAGTDGECEEARKKVKLKPFQATQAIDAWFKNHRERLVGAMDTITKAQNARLETVRRAAEAERLRKVQEAEEEAQRVLEAARAAPDDESKIDAAMEAESRVEQAKVEAAAPMQELTRTRSTMGVTTSGSEKWDFRLVSIKDLCRAVVAGTVPETFVTTNDPAVRLALKGKNGMRQCAGLEIYPETKINRRGAH